MGKKVISTDTIRYQIYDDLGEHNGTGFPFVEHSEALPHKFVMQPNKKYKMKITHIMRLDILDGICDVGVEIN